MCNIKKARHFNNTKGHLVKVAFSNRMLNKLLINTLGSVVALWLDLHPFQPKVSVAIF